MKVKTAFIILTFLCILTVNKIHSQIIEFYPVADTIFIGGGCTPSIINVSICESQTLLDTIKIVSGWNTNIWTSNPEKDEYQYPHYEVATGEQSGTSGCAFQPQHVW